LVLHIWDDLLSEQDKAVITKAGYDSSGSVLWDSRSLGQRPALLIVDMQEMLVGRDVPILEAISDYKAAMGSIAWRALQHILPFLGKVRQSAIPVFYTRVIPVDRSPEDPAVQIIESLTPEPGDILIDKPRTSAFHGTDLEDRLRRIQVDTLIVVGNSTSGCIRAAVVDAYQLGFHPLVPVECVFDRVEASHRIGLLDMWMKYAQVMPVSKAVEYVEKVARTKNGHRSRP
jgi:nicotinamidase-related amidase